MKFGKGNAANVIVLVNYDWIRKEPPLLLQGEPGSAALGTTCCCCCCCAPWCCCCCDSAILWSTHPYQKNMYAQLIPICMPTTCRCAVLPYLKEHRCITHIRASLHRKFIMMGISEERFIFYTCKINRIFNTSISVVDKTNKQSNGGALKHTLLAERVFGNRRTVQLQIMTKFRCSIRLIYVIYVP